MNFSVSETTYFCFMRKICWWNDEYILFSVFAKKHFFLKQFKLKGYGWNRRLNITKCLIRQMTFHWAWMKTEHLVINLSWINCVCWPTVYVMWYIFQHNHCWVAICTQLVVGPSKHGAIVGLWLWNISRLHCLLQTIFLEWMGMFG